MTRRASQMMGIRHLHLQGLCFGTWSEALYVGNLGVCCYCESHFESYADQLVKFVDTLIDLYLLESCHVSHLLVPSVRLMMPVPILDYVACSDLAMGVHSLVSSNGTAGLRKLKGKGKQARTDNQDSELPVPDHPLQPHPARPDQSGPLPQSSTEQSHRLEMRRHRI